MNKKLKLSILLGTLTAIISAPNCALAQFWVSQGNIGFDTILTSIKSAIWQIFAVFVVVMFVIAGIAFMTAQGDPEKLKTARSAFIWGVVGIAVAIIGYSIVAIVQSAL